MPRFHPQVRRDVSTAIRHYDSISDPLGDDFWVKFEQICHQVEAHPERFPRRVWNAWNPPSTDPIDGRPAEHPEHGNEWAASGGHLPEGI
jgi:hypothetical protein